MSAPPVTSRRALGRHDAAAVAALLAEDESVLFGHPSRLAPIDVLSWWVRVDLDADSWLLEEDGRPVAVGWLEVSDDLGVHVGAVAQRAKGRGLGGALVETAEARLRERGVLRTHTWTLAPDTRAAALFASRGYREVRRFYDMAIELEGPPPELDVPVETFREEDARAFHGALGEAFEDHWEHHPTPFDEWWEQKRNAPDYDPTLWFLVRDGDEIAAAIRNDPQRNGGGYVGALGVRRPWRGRGLGRALLLHTFGEFYRRGITRVTLGVDAASPTGATKLYESVGMRVETEAVVYEKELA